MRKIKFLEQIEYQNTLFVFCNNKLSLHLLNSKLNVTQSNWHNVESRPHFTASLFVCATFIQMIGIMIILLSLFNQKYSIAFKEQLWWSTGVQNYLFISNYVVEKNLRIIQTLIWSVYRLRVIRDFLCNITLISHY